ncbi:MAG: peptidase S8 [Deltaproteobacteria bacterium]|nr:peptidase S8 [Deltaproteobacteria bacterium]
MSLTTLVFPILLASQVPPSDGFLVDLDDGMSDAEVTAFARAFGLALRPNSEFSSRNRVYLAGQEAAALVQRLRGDARVEAAEPNWILSIPEPELLDLSDETDVPAPTDGKPKAYPDDPLYKSQWHMPMIHMDEAWARGKGKGAVVAVIDTGISDGKGKLPRVPDLEGTMFVPGYNFVADNAQPDDDHGHGTHVAGTIAQRTHNAFGVAGVAPEASLMPLKVLTKQGWGTAADIAEAIRWAADHKANVINMSLGGGGYSEAMAKAVKYAHDQGVVVVCAAGNTGRGRVEFPAAYPGALAVSAVGPDGEKAWYSSFGKETFIAAPGGDTRVDLNGDGIADGVLQDTIAMGDPMRHGFFPFQGTSMATPHVAGAAALVVARGVTKPDAVAKVLADSAEKRPDKLRFGNGLLSAGAAMKALDGRDEGRLLSVAGVLGLLAWAARRRLGSARARLGLGGLVAAIVVGAGLTPLAGSGLPWAGTLSTPLLTWDGALWGAPSALAMSVALPMVAALFLLGVGRLRGVLIGLAAGAAALLLGDAFRGLSDVAGIPGMGLLDTLWLAVNGVLSLALAWLLSRR